MQADKRLYLQQNIRKTWECAWDRKVHTQTVWESVRSGEKAEKDRNAAEQPLKNQSADVKIKGNSSIQIQNDLFKYKIYIEEK